MDNEKENYPDEERRQKETLLGNYRPMTCLLMMWKFLTAQIREEIYYSLLCHGLFPEEQKNTAGNKRNKWCTIWRTAQLQGSQNEAEKSSYVNDWLQWDIWYSPARMKNRMFVNVRNIRQNHKLPHECHGNLEDRINSGRPNPSSCKNLKKHLSGRITLLFVRVMMPLNQIFRKCTGTTIFLSQRKKSINLCIWMTKKYLQKMKKKWWHWYKQKEYTARIQEWNVVLKNMANWL